MAKKGAIVLGGKVIVYGAVMTLQTASARERNMVISEHTEALDWSNINNKPTTLYGYGITDAMSTPNSNVLYWDGDEYAPYANLAATSGNAYFYGATDNPTGTGRLNFNGYLYSRGLYLKSAVSNVLSLTNSTSKEAFVITTDVVGGQVTINMGGFTDDASVQYILTATETRLSVYYPGTTTILHRITGSTGIVQSYGTSRFGSNSHYTQISTAGHQTMVGNGRPWRDELGDVLSFKVQGTGVSVNTTENTVDFTAASDLLDYIYKNVQLNHDKDLTASLYPHIHWLQAENNVPNFLLEYRWQINGGAKTTAWTRLPCITKAFTYTAGTLNQICYSAGIAVPVGTTLSDIVQFRIYRDNGNTSGLFAGLNSYTATVGILSMDIHFQINSLGSDDEYSK